MARITTEDCTGKIPNHFDLTLVAARRARSPIALAAAGSASRGATVAARSDGA